MPRLALVVAIFLSACATPTPSDDDVVTLTRPEWVQVIKDAFRAGYINGWKNALEERGSKT